MTNQRLAVFAREKYISLESYRKSGEAIATPVWFAQDDKAIYVYSLADAFKVKRIRNNPKVRIAPCDMRGKVTGEWVDGRARIITDPDEDNRAHQLLDQKYGWMKRIGNLFSSLRRRARTAIAIELA